MDHKGVQADSMGVQNSIKGCWVYRWDTHYIDVALLFLSVD